MWPFSKRLIPRKNQAVQIVVNGPEVEVKSVHGNDTLARFRWEDVVKVTAFKRDLFIVDLICFELAFANETIRELNEEMLGWEEFRTSLETQLSGSRTLDSWFQKVAQPPFAEDATVIYERNVSS